ncbi:MAG TPA: hypothetical protein PLU72_18550 [Candidatus Ozemobacteraceae bacterium]|nr:hypothetical protein [Candidatus Ozemobacteraceae bacterium]HQG28798.1 hypothetical protein [Candidatus Ozemobacteraceae bacterium]
MNLTARRAILPAFCLFLLLSPFTAFGQGAGGALIGKVDFRALVLLHPSMMGYDTQKSAFRVEPSKATLPQQMERRSQEHKQRIEALESEIRALRAKITELHRNYTRDVTELNDRYAAGIVDLATGPAGMKRQQFELDKAQLDSTYQAKLQSASGRCVAATEELDHLQNISLAPGYTTPEETEARFNAIVKELRQLVQSVAARRGIQIVLNTSFQRSLRRERPARDSDEPIDLSYQKIFTTPFTREVGTSHDFTAGYYENIIIMTRNWLDHGSRILKPAKSSFIDSDIICGGVDLTGEVLTSLFSSYKVNQNIGAAVIKAALE